jgi:hypothetical protein
VTTIRRLVVPMTLLAIALTAAQGSSFAGASAQRVVAYNHLGLVDPVAITAHGKYLWIANLTDGNKKNYIVRVTASTGAHLSIGSPLFTRPWALISDGSYVWVVSGPNSSSTHASISRIDIATNKVSLVTNLHTLGFPVTLAIAGRDLWVAGVTNGTLLRVNRSTLSTSIVSSALFGAGEVLTADKKYLWVASDSGGPLGRGSLARVSLSTGAIKGINSPYFNDPVTVTSNGTSVWLPASNHVVTKVEIATSKVTKVSSKSFNTPLWSGSTAQDAYMLSDSGEYPVAGGDLTQINSSTNSIDAITSKLIVSPLGLAILGPNVWIINTPAFSHTTATFSTKNLLVRVTP